MTEEQYEQELKERLVGVHPVLASALRSVAWDRGHAYGYSEVILILDNLKEDFAEVNRVLIHGV
jgi:hypothetical protein